MGKVLVIQNAIFNYGKSVYNHLVKIYGITVLRSGSETVSDNGHCKEIWAGCIKFKQICVQFQGVRSVFVGKYDVTIAMFDLLIGLIICSRYHLKDEMLSFFYGKDIGGPPCPSGAFLGETAYHFTKDTAQL